jgi:hypothetical protein
MERESTGRWYLPLAVKNLGPFQVVIQAGSFETRLDGGG